MYDLITEPEMKTSVHLDQFAKISTVGPMGMYLGSVQRFKLVEDGTHFLDGILSSFERKDAFSEDSGLQVRRADRNTFMFFKKFRKMSKVGIIIFGTIQIVDQTFDILRKRGRRLPSYVLMKTSLAFRFIFDDRTIDVREEQLS